MAGGYEPVALTTAPDGILKGHSAILGLSLCWDDNWPRLYDPATNTCLETWQQERAARQAAESERAAAEARAAVEQAGRLAEQAARRSVETRAAAERDKRRAVESELQQLRVQLRQRPTDS